MDTRRVYIKGLKIPQWVTAETKTELSTMATRVHVITSFKIMNKFTESEAHSRIYTQLSGGPRPEFRGKFRIFQSHSTLGNKNI